MRDIFEELSDGYVTFTAETERGQAWMRQRFHETNRTYALTIELDRAEAERFKKDAAKDGIGIYGL